MKFLFDLSSFIIRAFQLIWTIISLGMAAGIVNDVSFDRSIYTLVISVLTIIYLAVVLLPFSLRYMSPLVILVMESIFMILWLASFAAMADTFGQQNCRYFDFYYSSNWCKLGKGLIAFGVLNWLTFCLSLVLLLVFTAVPCMRAGGIRNTMARNNFKMGAIVSELIPSKATQDVENTVGTTDADIAPEASGESKVVDKVESPATPTDEASGESRVVDKVESPATPTDEVSP